MRSAIHPITTRVNGFGPSFTYSTAWSNNFVFAPILQERTALSPLNQPRRPSILSSAEPRTEQVFIIAKSATCAEAACFHPLAISNCSTAADSAIFISHPYVSKK